MKKVCAWCNKSLGGSGESGPGNEPITHGICPGCRLHMEASSVGVPLRRFLDQFEAPVVLVADDGRVVSGNTKAMAMVDKSRSGIEGIPGGRVFECEYSYLPEGCGSTVHCAGCTIRNTVMDTLRTGISHLREPAVLNHAGGRRIALEITTEKAGESVLLRIDTMEGAVPGNPK